MPRMITSRLRGFFKHVLMHIHALDCTSRRVEGKQLKIITSYVSSPRRSGARFPHQSPPRRAWCVSVEFCEPPHLECCRFAASERSLSMQFSLNVRLILSLVIILRFTLAALDGHPKARTGHAFASILNHFSLFPSF